MAEHKCAMCGYEFPINQMYEVLVCGNCVDQDGDDLAKSERELSALRAENERLRDRDKRTRWYLENIKNTARESLNNHRMIKNYSVAEEFDAIVVLAEESTKALESESDGLPKYKFQQGEYDADGGVIPSVESEE